MRWRPGEVWAFLSVLTLAGCGLVLEAGPPRPDAAVDGRDGGREMDAGRLDAGDTAVALDARSGDEGDTRVLVMDGNVPAIDASAPDATPIDIDASIDAARPPTMPDSGLRSLDSAGVDARDAPDGDARDAPDGDARDAHDGDARDGMLADTRDDARTTDAFCTSSGICDLLTQCGCPSAQACQFGPPPAFSPVCIAPGPTGRGGFCMAEAECGRGLTCSYLDAPPGVCTPFCAPGSICAGGGLCLSLGPVADPLSVGACSPNCNPIDTGSCAGGLVCDVANDPSSFSYCRVRGLVTVGRSCSSPTDCGGRASCVGGACRALCATGVPCATGTCTSFTPPITIGAFPIGFCAG